MVCAFSHIMREVDKLRSEVMRAQRLASDKMRRLKKSTGANVKGSEFDPTRDTSKVRRYNASQLKSYLSELNAFRDRSVQFLGGSKGAPIPRAAWNRYASVQATYNKMAQHDFASVAGIKLQGGQTIGEREATFLPDERSAGGRAANRPKGGINIKPGQVFSADALPMLEGRLRSRMAGQYQFNAIAAQRIELGEMLGRAGLEDLRPMVGKMNDRQFNALWNYTDFPDFISTRYEAMKHMSASEEAHVSDEFRGEVVGTLKWAQRIR